jgi:hypothetical protein
MALSSKEIVRLLRIYSTDPSKTDAPVLAQAAGLIERLAAGIERAAMSTEDDAIASALRDLLA